MHRHKIAKLDKKTNQWTLESLPGAVNPAMIESFEGNDLEIQTLKRKFGRNENILDRKASRTRVLSTSSCNLEHNVEAKLSAYEKIAAIREHHRLNPPRYPKVREAPSKDVENRKKEVEPKKVQITKVHPPEHIQMPKAKNENTQAMLSFWTFLCSCGGQTRIVPLETFPRQQVVAKKKESPKEAGTRFSQAKPTTMARAVEKKENSTDKWGHSRKSQVITTSKDINEKKSRGSVAELEQQKTNRLVSKTTNDMDLVDMDDDAVSSDSLKAEPGSALQLGRKEYHEKEAKVKPTIIKKEVGGKERKNVGLIDSKKRNLVDMRKQNTDNTIRIVTPRRMQNRVGCSFELHTSKVEKFEAQAENPTLLQELVHYTSTPREGNSENNYKATEHKSKVQQSEMKGPKLFRIDAPNRVPVAPKSVPGVQPKRHVNDNNSGVGTSDSAASQPFPISFKGKKEKGKPQIIKVTSIEEEQPLPTKGLAFTVKSYFQAVFGCLKASEEETDVKHIPPVADKPQDPVGSSVCSISPQSSRCSSSLSSISVKAVVSIESLRSSVNSNTQRLIESEDDDEIETMFKDRMLSQDASKSEEHQKNSLQSELPPLPPINYATKSSETAFLPSIAPVPPVRYKANPLLPPRRLDSLPSSLHRRQTEEKSKLSKLREDDTVLQTSDFSVQEIENEINDKTMAYHESASSIVLPFKEPSSTPRASKLHAFIETYEEENDSERDIPDTPCSVRASRGSPINYSQKESTPGKINERDRESDAESDNYSFFFS